MEVGDFPIKDKVVAVTGGGSGICAAFVKRCANLGAKGVIIGDLRMTPEADKTLKAFNNVVFQKTDVCNWDDLHRLVTGAKEKFGSTPDIYIGGAGIFEPPEVSSFWHDPEQDNRYRIVDINLNHPIKLARIAMRTLVSENKKGVIIPIASLGGYSSTYHCPLYVATKHGIVGFVKSMKFSEKLEGVKIVTVCPGAVDSNLWTEEKKELVGFSALESLKPDDVAKVMVDLVQEGKYVGGTCLEIMPYNGAKTRVIPEWNIDPPQGSTTTKIDMKSTEIPSAFREAKRCMDAERCRAMNGEH